jgi:hypothetical protein
MSSLAQTLRAITISTHVALYGIALSGGAWAAVLAGLDRGADGKALSDKERARLRQQALAWLRAELEAERQRLAKDGGKARAAVAKQLRLWMAEGDFAGVRGQAALAGLPESERRAWQTLWQEVKALYLRVAPPRVAAGRRP